MLVVFADGTIKDLIPQVAEYVISNGSATKVGEEVETVKSVIVPKKEVKKTIKKQTNKKVK